MGRCEGYYKLENRRCDRDGEGQVRASDGQSYLVCGYHASQTWTTSVARWNGETGIRETRPTQLDSAQPQNQPQPRLVWG